MRFSERHVTFLLVTLAIVYAFLSGLRTVSDFDTGWQLAAGRYIAQHHVIPSVDVFSSTVRGTPWIYPPLSELIFYALHSLGGFAALSLLNAFACAAAVAICLYRGTPVSAVLACLAVPLIASRTQPRAELFTIVLFAAMLRICWNYLQTGKAPLWLLPVLMAVWVNLHLGFVAGLALLIAYVAAEAGNLLYRDRRAETLSRLRHAAPYIALSFVATVLNRWGVYLFLGVARQNKVAGDYAQLVGEWHRQPVTRQFLAQAFHLRSPDSGFWWLLLAAIVGAVVAAYRRDLPSLILLLPAAYLSLAHLRFQATFALVVIVVAGSLFQSSKSSTLLAPLLALAMLAFVSLRIADLTSNRTYLTTGEITTFGVGRSWWFPAAGADFVLQHHLPPQLFNTFDAGGYLMWKLGPQYPVFIDGRAIPFGNQFIQHAGALLRTDPDSPAWIGEADRRGIQTLFLPTARYAGIELFPLQQYCRSRQWIPVYLDDVSLVLVRNTPANASLTAQFRIDCQSKVLQPTAEERSSAARLYNFYANAGAIYYLLERDADALDAYHRALSIFAADPNLHLAIGQLYDADGQQDLAEREYRTSIALRPTDLAWYALARLLASEQRYPEAADAMRHSAELSYDPAARYRALADLENKARHAD